MSFASFKKIFRKLVLTSPCHMTIQGNMLFSCDDLKTGDLTTGAQEGNGHGCNPVSAGLQGQTCWMA
jgi:hypothetical protein